MTVVPLCSAFRGTQAYASPSAHEGRDLGRVDDLWSLLFVLVDLVAGSLPWKSVGDREEVGRLKRVFCDVHSSGPPSAVGAAAVAAGGAAVAATLRAANLLPPALRRFVRHLNELDYADRPDYALLESLLAEVEDSAPPLPPPAAAPALAASGGAQPAPRPLSPPVAAGPGGAAASTSLASNGAAAAPAAAGDDSGDAALLQALHDSLLTLGRRVRGCEWAGAVWLQRLQGLEAQLLALLEQLEHARGGSGSAADATAQTSQVETLCAAGCEQRMFCQRRECPHMRVLRTRERTN